MKKGLIAGIGAIAFIGLGGAGPMPDDGFRAPDMAMVLIGHQLFYDPILSGNRNIACATCHHPRYGTSDGLSLGLGEGAVGLGPERHPDPANPPEGRIPRNAPALFNLGAAEFTALFHDGRVELDASAPGGFRTPLEGRIPVGLDSLLAVQTIFPILSSGEMAGQAGENDVADALRAGRILGPGGALGIIAERVAAIPAYRAMYSEALPEVAGGRALTYPDIANALAAFVAYEWRADDSLFDHVQLGEARLSPMAEAGRALFYGAAGCATCHAGKFQTDHGYHAMAAPQLGPGKAEPHETHPRDLGRMRVTGKEADAYAFRTPSLRNVTATAPYGHAGGHTDLAGFLAYHADPRTGLARYVPQAVLPAFTPTRPDWAFLAMPEERRQIAEAVTSPPVSLGNEDIARLIAFLGALTDETALQGRLGIPDRVPSGLPVDR